MSLDLENTLAVIELMENYVERIRPEPNIRKLLDISYLIDNQSIQLIEIRPKFGSTSGEITESPYAKATYIKAKKIWKIYWMRGNLQWALYQPKPIVGSLQEFIIVVEEDKYHCFKG